MAIYDVKKPNKGSKLREIVDWLLVASYHNDLVDVTPLLDSTLTLSKFRGLIRRLGTKYHFYVRFTGGGNMFLVGKWPGYTPGPYGRDIYHIDERYKPHQKSTVKTLYRPAPAKGTILFDIYRYLLIHKQKGGLCDISTLHARHGSITVHKKIRVLNQFYGFEITKPVKGRKDNLVIVKKKPNRQVQETFAPSRIT